MSMNLEHRARLEEAGLWRKFAKRRVELINQGIDSVEAYNQALSECFPSGVPPRPSVAEEGGGEEVRAEVRKETGLPVRSWKADKKADAKETGLPVVDQEEFEGRECGAVASILWVARNMDVIGLKAADCPDPIAWSLLTRCRKNASFAEDFWRSMFPKVLPSKSAMGEEKPSEFDGERELKLIESFRATGIRIAESVAS